MCTRLSKLQFKKMFQVLADKRGFRRHNLGWYRESTTSKVRMVTLLRLLNSRWMNGFDAWLYIKVDGLFGHSFQMDQSLLNSPTALFRVEQTEFADLFDLDSLLSECERQNKLVDYFDSVVVPIAELIEESNGFLTIAKKSLAQITPSVRADLERMGIL